MTGTSIIATHGNTYGLGQMTDDIITIILRKLDQIDAKQDVQAGILAKLEQAETTNVRQQDKLFHMVGELQTGLAAFRAECDACESTCKNHSSRIEHIEAIVDASDWDREKADSLRNLLATWDAITGAVKAAFSKILIGVILVGMIGALAALGIKVELPK